MAKNILSDVVIKKKRTSLPNRETTEKKSVASAKVENFSPKISIDGDYFSNYKKKDSGVNIPIGTTRENRFSFVLPISIFIAILILLSAYTIIFAKAKIEMTLNEEPINILTNISATKSATSGLGFETITISGEKSSLIQATSQKIINKNASGSIIIYNNWSTAPQKLVKNTRFETPDGKIYRITAPISVPGYKKTTQGTVPGSTETIVYSDQPGENYNSPLTDFTLPGFKGDPRFEKIFARSKSEISGGFSGAVNVASDEQIQTAKDSLKNELQTSLFADALNQIPRDHVLYDNAYDIKFSDGEPQVSNQTSGANMAQISLKATFVGILLDKEQLEEEIIKVNNINGTAADHNIENLQKLTFSLNNKSGADIESSKTISFALSGSTTIKSIVNEDELRKDLAGKNKIEFQDVFKKYESIKTAHLQLDPLWIRKIPDDESKIVLKTTNPTSK